MYIYDLYGGSAVGKTLDRKGQDLPVREACAILGEREVPKNGTLSMREGFFSRHDRRIALVFEPNALYYVCA